MADETTEETQDVTETEDTQTVTDDDSSGIAEETEESAPSEETVDDQAAGTQKGGVQKKIDKLTKQRAEAEREAAYWRGKAEGSTTGDMPAEPAKGKLDPNDFATYEEYVDAVADAKIEERIAKIEAERTQSAETRQKQKMEEVFQKARAKYEDFDEIAFAPTGVVTNPEVLKILQTTGDSMGDLLYYLGSNPEVSRRINAMSPINAAIELGAVKAKITQKPKVKPNKTNAPPPLEVLGGGGEASQKSVDKMSFAELKAKWEAERIARLTGGKV